MKVNKDSVDLLLNYVVFRYDIAKNSIENVEHFDGRIKLGF